MRTRVEYLDKLKSMKKNVYLDGALVERDDPLLLPGINVVSETFDYAWETEYEQLMLATSHLSGGPINRFCQIHRSREDLLKKQEMTRLLCKKTGGCIQRCMGIDVLNALSIVTKNMDLELGTNYYQRFLDY